MSWDLISSISNKSSIFKLSIAELKIAYKTGVFVRNEYRFFLNNWSKQLKKSDMKMSKMVMKLICLFQLIGYYFLSEQDVKVGASTTRTTVKNLNYLFLYTCKPSILWNSHIITCVHQKKNLARLISASVCLSKECQKRFNFFCPLLISHDCFRYAFSWCHM